MKNTIQEMQDYLWEYIDQEYPKGSADRGHATVHIVKFLHDFLHHTKDAHMEQLESVELPNKRQEFSPYRFPDSHPLQLNINTLHFHGQSPCWNNPCVWCGS